MKIKKSIIENNEGASVYIEVTLEKEIIYEKQNLKLIKKGYTEGSTTDFNKYYNKKENDTFLIECDIHSEAEVLAFKKELKTLIDFFKTNENIAIARDAKLKKAVEEVMQEYSEYEDED